MVKKFRTIKGCLEELKLLDPNTAIKLWYIRMLCKENCIEYRLAGNKSLVNFTSLLEYLNKEAA